MPRFRAALFSFLALGVSGCGYIHFGRIPPGATPLGDSKMAEAYADLSTEHKILKQELALARRETDALRVALERSGTSVPANVSDLAIRLSETAAELATVRASYAKLQAERSQATAATGISQENEAKSSVIQREQAELQAENTRLRGEIDRARTENLALAERLTATARQHEEAQAALAQLNVELLQQKQARARAEQSGEALRTQLSAVMAQSASTGLSALQIAKAPPAGASPTAELRLNTEQLRSAVPEPERPPARTHTVQPGDTLEKIAQRYYGGPDRWRTIYDANAGLLSTGQPLRAGMELVIPKN